MKYKIEITGRGVDCYVHKITEEQRNNLIETNADSIDDVADILSIDDVFDTDLVHTGFYNDSENYIIKVRYVDSNKTLELIEYYFDDYDYISIYYDDNYLIISDQVKGNIFNYEIDIEGDFDIGKLKPIILDLCDNIEIITDFTYDGKELTDNKEYGDYDSKGFSYYLCEKEEDESPEPNEALKSAKEKHDEMLDVKPPYVSDDFQIGPDGAHENVDEWDPDYMDGKNEDTWFDELDINPNWKKHLKKFNLSPEVWNVICRLHYGETMALKQSMEEQLNWIQKYNNLKKNIKNLLD
jgi:hypothetical protein